MTPLERDFARVEARIRAACRQAERARATVQLIAVSKTRNADAIRALHRLGQCRFGENYVQEFVAKADALPASTMQPPLEWHFIGPVQGNKTRLIAERAHWVHGLDRLKIAERLSRQRAAEHGPLQVCIQVNLSGEPSKSGIAETAVPALADAVAVLPGLVLRGLMTLPAPSHTLAQQRQPFARLRDLQNRLNDQGHQFDTLSMGMSDDLEAAILEGATLVRVGTALFGPRIDPRTPQVRHS